MDEIALTCLNGHILQEVNDGFGTRKKKTRCSDCRHFGNDDFISCIQCKYDLCVNCRADSLSSRKEKDIFFIPKDECTHDNDKLTYKETKLYKGECRNEVCDKESDSHYVCNCGITICKHCYDEIFPENNNKNTAKKEEVESSKSINNEKVEKEEKEEKEVAELKNSLKSKQENKVVVESTNVVQPVTNEETPNNHTTTHVLATEVAQPDNDPRKCKNGHFLEDTKDTDHLKTCDKCGVRGLPEYYFCSKCDYTHCHPCYKGEIHQKAGDCCIIA